MSKKSAKQPEKVVEVVQKPLKLDIGCGKNKREGFIGVDILDFPGVDQKVDIRKAPWPWADDSVEEVNCSHFLEHLTAPERIIFFNELYRVCKKDSKTAIVVPHWSSMRAYGDPTHQWPPVVEFFWYYLSKDWRVNNSPHVGFTCDFVASWGYSIHPVWQVKSQEVQQFGVNHYREVAQDMIATLVCKK
ncbi:methyltransferase [Caudoviricetes sp.]|nr:methyltransferase [Caudoviricetes sp.]UOF81031.1 methyltransferase [Caudoviricetes sp.]UOF81385.1 methyltransferase [Caudoviricetes sp.]